MKKYMFMFFSVILVLLVVGCEKKEASIKENGQVTTEALVSEKTTEDNTNSTIIAEGSGSGMTTPQESTNYQTAGDANELEELPDTIESLNNGSACDPVITNASIMHPLFFHREKLVDAVLSYMYVAGIKNDTCKEIHVDEMQLDNALSYKMTLKFNKSKEREVVVYWTNNTCYDIQTYIDDGDIGFDPNELP